MNGAVLLEILGDTLLVDDDSFGTILSAQAQDGAGTTVLSGEGCGEGATGFGEGAGGFGEGVGPGRGSGFGLVQAAAAACHPQAAGGAAF